MRVRNWIADAWRRVSLRNGFEEYDSPIFEYLDLFEAKSGPEIAEQLFAFTDRGGRRLAIRPETTPALARMVNAKVNSLPRPIKWFSISRLCRAENPQKGRLREFFQWNIDILGEPSPQADAECVLVAVDALRELGLTADEVKVRYASRALVTAVLRASGVGEEQIPKVLAVLDKRDKVPAGAFEAMLRQAVPHESARRAILRFLDTQETTQAAVTAALGGDLPGDRPRPRSRRPSTTFGSSRRRWPASASPTGAGTTRAWCEGWRTTRASSMRSLTPASRCGPWPAGGGTTICWRSWAGRSCPGRASAWATWCWGSCWRRRASCPAEFPGQRLDFFVIDADGSSAEQVLAVVAALRQGGLAADFCYKRQPLGKQLKEANRRAALRAAIRPRCDRHGQGPVQRPAGRSARRGLPHQAPGVGRSPQCGSGGGGMGHGMAHRDNHYEAAFEDYLRAKGWPYVAVDEAKKAIFASAALKSFDFVVYSSRGPNLIVDVKGRKFPDGIGGRGKGASHVWENWITRQDVEGLGQWQEVFGSAFVAMLVFAYWLQGPPQRSPFADVHVFRQRHYAFLGVPLAAYMAAARPRSQRWQTVAVPAAAFARLATDVSSFL